MELEAVVSGRRVRYLEGGSGQPLVLLHAFPLAADLWRPQLALPPEGWRLLAPDCRGLGGSARAAGTGEGGRVTVDDYAADLLAFCDVLGLDRFALGGLSMGGYVAFAVLRQAGARVTALLLADTRTEADSDEARENRRAMRAQVLDQGAGVVADVMLPKLLGRTTRASHQELTVIVRRMIDANTPEGIADAVDALMSRPDSAATLEAVACPVAIVVGDEDVLTPVALHEDMHRRASGSTLHVIRRAGHLSNLERPEAFNDALRGLLARL
jgi:3-oxoadipate enol-lactonase